MSRLILALLMIVNFNCQSQALINSYEIATWQGFKSSAVSYTFDDNCPNQLLKAVPMFDEVGFKLTLFTTTSYLPNWAGLAIASQNGHEIGNHTVSHPDLRGLPLAQQKNEIITCNDLINTNIVRKQVSTIAYPFCSAGNDSLCKSLFIAGRGCSGVIETLTPNNFMNISSIICGANGAVKSAQDFQTIADNAASSNGWLVYLIHGIDNDGGYSSLSSISLKTSVDYLKANNSKFWVSTFGNVAQYIRERNCIDVHELSASDTEITLSATDTLDNALYFCPVSVRSLMPLNWATVSATQNALPVNISVVELNSLRYMMFDVVPDGGEIKITKTGDVNTALQYCTGIDDIQFSVSNHQLTFDLPQFSIGQPHMSIFNINGVLVDEFVISKASNTTCSFALPNYLSGSYLFLLRDGEASWKGQFFIR